MMRTATMDSGDRGKRPKCLPQQCASTTSARNHCPCQAATEQPSEHQVQDFRQCCAVRLPVQRRHMAGPREVVLRRHLALGFQADYQGSWKSGEGSPALARHHVAAPDCQARLQQEASSHGSSAQSQSLWRATMRPGNGRDLQAAAAVGAMASAKAVLATAPA
mmetsp:Transcript_30157/g.82893  ORF Transcript_30157/g.82893 Transcript_30157/m.82893 type:complete len:163 (+) Transcript_30157:1858-2346(+)